MVSLEFKDTTAQFAFKSFKEAQCFTSCMEVLVLRAVDKGMVDRSMVYDFPCAAGTIDV
eukprot:NODE_5155_length_608_cov_241.235081.p2 GENE.NODE_5155_length_608_cov_241.235081~~NODE_5155_length_608_cov_241.235081.p2  ORF type:complete len:59 (-),score=16.51 NODE_5155_length_608_cov_241.235081:233-409(-)